jgi:type I restriction enzyme S subunit
MVEAETKIQRYDTYKESGVEWLGEIPEHWELTRLGTRFKERRTKVSDKDYPALSVTKNGTVPQLANAAKTNDGDNRKLVKEGDFVINSRSDRKGSSGIAFQDGSVSLINIVMEPLSIHPIYCNYLLKSYNFVEEFYRMGHGIVADLWTTRYDEMKAIMVGIPQLPEQTKIAQFLDDKTTKIEDAITIKQQQINLLKERKQILIHKAVTRGLDDSVTLKDSGVEWIGEIPENWDCVRIKHLSKKITDGEHISPEFTDDGMPFLSAKDIRDGFIEFPNNKFVSERDGEKFRQRCNPERGDLLLVSRGATIGRVSQVDTDREFCLLGSVILIKTNKKIINAFLVSAMSNDRLKDEFLNTSDHSAQQAIYLVKVAEVYIPIPPLSEQKEISAYIETASQKIETAIGLKQQEIAKLKEYKSSLINGVVTGKVRVC